MRRLRLFLSAALLVGLVAAAGCGGKKAVTVQGKIVLPQNLAFQDDDAVEIRFVPSDAKAKGASTQASIKELSFTSKDIAPGQYKVTVTVTPYAGKPDSQKRTTQLEPFNMAYNEKQTKLSLEVTDAPMQNVTLDLGKQTVSKN